MLRVLLCTAVALALLVASSAAPETHARSEAPPASAAGRGRRVSAWQRQRRNEFKLSQNLDDAHNASISDDEESGSGGTSDEADHESSASASANASTEERVEFANGTSTDAMGNVNSVKSSSNPSGLLSPVNNASSPANSQTPTPLLPVAGNAPRANATDSAVVSSGTSTTTSPSPSSSSPPFEAVGAVWPKKKESVAELFRKLKSKLEREVTEFLENNQLLVVCSVFALIFILFLIPGLVFYCCCRACRRRQRTHQQLERRTSFTSQVSTKVTLYNTTSRAGTVQHLRAVHKLKIENTLYTY